MAREPQLKKSKETEKQEQITMAERQGEAFGKALDYMANEEANDGGKKSVGDYVVAYAVEEAEGMYMPNGDGIEWKEPTKENAHIEVAVCDKMTGRFMPGLKVQATLIDSDGKEVGTHEQPFLWHPWLYHYGRNWQVPGEGKYTLKVRIDPAAFGRHDRVNGKRFAEPVEVEFDGVQIEPGQKK